MFLYKRHNRTDTPVALSGSLCRAKFLNDTVKIIFITAAVLLLLLAQTKTLLAENSLNKTGSINRTPVSNKAATKIQNFSGVTYELIEVRDELNDIIAYPERYEEAIIEEEVIVTTVPEVKTPAAPPVQKKEVVVAKKPKPKAKPIIAKSLKVLPVQETHSDDADKIIAVTETIPVYNKHDIDGKLLQHDTEKWTCIHDTENGLMWEVKSKDDDMRNSNNLYSWFKSNEQIANGIADGGRCQGNIACDTSAYVQAMNKQNFCGHNDWQLPTREQMQTLVYLKNNEEPVKINQKYFPETVASWYWTASENNDNNDFAWYVLFRNGVALNDLKERPKHIRLVRDHTQQIAKYE